MAARTASRTSKATAGCFPSERGRHPHTHSDRRNTHPARCWSVGFWKRRSTEHSAAAARVAPAHRSTPRSKVWSSGQVAGWWTAECVRAHQERDWIYRDSLMNTHPLQIEALAHDRRQSLLREAEMDRIADQLRLAESPADNWKPPSRRIGRIWRGLAGSASLAPHPGDTLLPPLQGYPYGPAQG
jgi:hypothetical protein